MRYNDNLDRYVRKSMGDTTYLPPGGFIRLQRPANFRVTQAKNGHTRPFYILHGPEWSLITVKIITVFKFGASGSLSLSLKLSI